MEFDTNSMREREREVHAYVYLPIVRYSLDVLSGKIHEPFYHDERAKIANELAEFCSPPDTI